MKRETVYLLIVALLLAGCTVGTTPQGTSSAVVTVTPAGSATAAHALTTAPSPEATQAPSATPAESTATEAPSATATSMPKPTLSPTPLPTRTPSPTLTPTPSPTAIASWWEVSSLLVGPGNPGRLYALQRKAGGAEIDSAEVRLLMSDDDGQTWSPFPGELPAKECLHNVDMDYAQIDALYASTCSGLYRWSGSGWDLVSPQETALVAVVYGQPQVLWAVQAPDKGHVVIRSDDGGVTWTPADTGLVSFNGVATLGIDPTDANREYAVIWPKYAGSYLRRGNGSGLWETMPTPNSNMVIDPSMAIDGATGNLYVVTSLTPYQLWRSRNPGADLTAILWDLLHDFGPDVWVHLLAAGPGPTGPTLYANITCIRQLGGGFIDVGPALLQRSLDAGQTWTALPIPSGDK
jgi:hypothetical protein